MHYNEIHWMDEISPENWGFFFWVSWLRQTTRRITIWSDKKNIWYLKKSASEFSAIERQRTMKSMEMSMMGSEFKRTNKENMRTKILLVGINERITCKIPLIIISGTHFSTFPVFFSRQHLYSCSTLMPSSFQPKMKTKVYLFIYMPRRYLLLVYENIGTFERKRLLCEK